MKKHPKSYIIIFTCLLSSFNGYCQNYADTIDNIFSTPLAGQWVVPNNVTSIRVQCWGGGGAGGGASGQAAAGGGGSGGAYTEKSYSTSPSTVYSYSVGNGGAGSFLNNGGPGSNTWFSSSTSLMAKGGGGGNAQPNSFATAAGAPSVTSGNVGGVVNFYGGAGGTGGFGPNGSQAGGGGGGAGTQANGQAASVNQGGQGGTIGGGDGAFAGSVGCNCNGYAGDTPGGGGSGGQASGVADKAGGKGGGGRIVISYSIPGIGGKVYLDDNFDCVDNGESGLDNVRVFINPGNFITQTDINGNWKVNFLPAGTYTVTIDTTYLNKGYCLKSQTINYTNIASYLECAPFGIQSNSLCTSPSISIFAPLMRRCLGLTSINVSACNQISASLPLNSSYVDVRLDSRINFTSASIPYTSLGGNVFRFQTGDINPGQCVNFSISASICNGTSIFQTLCMEANLYPADSCVLDTVPSGGGGGTGGGGTGGGGGGIPCSLPWDRSSLSVDGYCQNDSACFIIRNTGDPGNGDMECYSQIRIFVDGVLTVIDSLMIPGGDSLIYCYYANGQTIRLEVDQHPLHPGNSQPNDVVELCGNPSNWTPGLVTSQPQNDSDPVVDIFCGTIRGSFDPNDKTGFPTGLTNQNYVQPNQQLQYMIRFQNTGNDTAFTVVIRDTLDTDLNIFTVVQGVASHPYEFRMYGPRVLEWTFNNILLPDSNVNEPGSHGFATFQVEQVPNLANGTIIENDAEIYFDFNSPITTNKTNHTIYNGYPLVSETQEPETPSKKVAVFPNPSNGYYKVIVDKDYGKEKYHVYDMYGSEVNHGYAGGENFELDLNLSNGMYFFKIRDVIVKLQIIK